VGQLGAFDRAFLDMTQAQPAGGGGYIMAFLYISKGKRRE
jgi:hypothetical protein